MDVALDPLYKSCVCRQVSKLTHRFVALPPRASCAVGPYSLGDLEWPIDRHVNKIKELLRACLRK